MAEQHLTVVRWYEPRDRSADIVHRWLTAATRHLPEAVPIRFDDSEPLRHRFDTEEKLADGYRRADGLLFLQCSPPVLHASLAAQRVPRYWGRYGAHSLKTTLSPTDQRLQRFVMAVSGPATVYASASVEHEQSPAEQYLAPLGLWHGPPPQPPPWFWLCPAYARRMRDGWLPARFCARFDEIEPSQRRAARIPWGLR